MKKKLLVNLVFLACIPVLAQAPDTVWTKTYGGNSAEMGHSVQKTSDGGYIITGWTMSFGAGSSDVWLIKTNASGDTLWTKTFGGSEDDEGFSVQQTTDGGYIITGYTKSFGAGGYDVWLIKTDASGDTLWTKTFGGSEYDEGFSVQQTTDGGYIITGYTMSFGVSYCNVWLIKTDASGDTLWTKTFGLYGTNIGYSVQQTTDGGYILLGQTESFGAGSNDVWLIKTDTSGDTLWTKTFGGDYVDVSRLVQQNTNGGYILVGATSSFGAGSYDVWLIKTDASGDTLWAKTFGGIDDEWGHSVQQTIDGGYIITGYTMSFGAGSSDVWLIKTDASGDTLWTKTYGGSSAEMGFSVQQTLDEGYLITGYTMSFGAGSWDIWLIKTAPDVSDIEPNKNLMPSDFSLAQNYPNPFNPSTKIEFRIADCGFVTLKVYDILGNEIATLVNEEKQPGTYEVEFSAKGESASGGNAYNLPSGVYIYSLRAGSFAQTRKMILLK